MKISLKWLNYYVDIGYNISEIENTLCLLGFEVEEITPHKFLGSNIVAGKVLEVVPLEGSNKIKLCKVYDGKENIVLCGAPIININALYAFAPINSRVGDIIITPKKILNTTSNGMLCSGKELGFNTEDLLELNENEFKPGDILPLDYDIDYVFDLSITPNRNDCFNHQGIAREIAAFLDKPFKKEGVFLQNFHLSPTVENINIENFITSENDLYYAVVKDISSSSSFLMKKLLSTIDFKIIHNAVDLCNFIMMDCGQPMHAYDLEKIHQETVKINILDSNRLFTGLDNKEYKLPAGTMVLQDNENILSIIGVMGSSIARCQRETKNILIESGNFDPSRIFRTERDLNIFTESSYRFVRGLFKENSLYGLKYFLNIIRGKLSNIKSIYNEEISLEQLNCIISEKFQLYGEGIKLVSSDFYQSTGLAVSIEKQINILQRLGYECKMIYTDQENSQNKDIGIEAIPPCWKKNKIVLYTHLIEEIIRIYGVNNLETYSLKKPSNNIIFQKRSEQDFHKENIKNVFRTIISSAGYNEVINFSFYDEKYESKTQLSHLKINNPISGCLSSMRRSIILSLLDSIGPNIAIKNNVINIFEIGEVYPSLEQQEDWIGGIILKNDFVHTFKNEELKNENSSINIFEIIQSIELILENYGANQIVFSKESALLMPKYFAPGSSVFIKINNETIGAVGRISPEFNIHEVYGWELWKIPDITEISISYDKSNIPLNEVDISFQVKDDVPVENIINFCKTNHESIQDLVLLKIYPLEKHYKSITTRFYLRFNTTPEKKQINDIIDAISKKTCNEFNAIIR